MKNRLIIPYIKNNQAVITYFLKKIYNIEPIVLKKSYFEILGLGKLYSPEKQCLAFKYDLGYIIESIRNGGNIYLKITSGCPKDYYFELLEQTVSCLGYKLAIVIPTKNNKMSLKEIYLSAKKYNPKLNIITFTYNLIKFIIMLLIDNFVEDNKKKYYSTIENKAQNEIKYNEYLEEYQRPNIKIVKLIKKSYCYYKNCKSSITSNKYKKIMIIGIYNSTIDNIIYKEIEEKLSQKGIAINQYDTSYNRFLSKTIHRSSIVSKTKKYLKYYTDYDEIYNIYNIIEQAKKGLNGIIYIKMADCQQEYNSLDVINHICNNLNIPITYLDYNDLNTIKSICMSQIKSRI